MPASAASVVAKLATNPATAQTVPKSLRNLRPLREKKHTTVPYSTQRAQRTQNIPKYRNNKDSTENLCAICGLCVKTKHRFFPNSTQRAQRTQSSIYIISCQPLREKIYPPFSHKNKRIGRNIHHFLTLLQHSTLIQHESNRRTILQGYWMCNGSA